MSWEAIVAKTSPILGQALGGPIGGIVGSLVAQLFGGSVQNPDELAQKIIADPEAALKIKQLEYNHKEQLETLANSQFATEVDDRKDARKYGYNNRDFMKHFTYLVTIGFFAAMFLLFCPMNLSAEEKQMLSLLIGVLGSKWQTIIDFYFGSARSANGIVSAGKK